LLERGADLRAAIHTRVRNNLSRARDLVRRYPSCDLLPVEGGWTAPLRVPASRSEDTLVLALLQHEGILVHPGYFFDFPHEAFLVFSLLPEEHRYADALERVLQFVQA
jgi:alanine-synthesizing transaminase